MLTNLNKISYEDPPPERIRSNDWHELFKTIPEEFVNFYRYYRHIGKKEWNTYLFPPSSFLIYGSRYLRKLKFDNSLACLRLWGFMLSESERLFRAKQIGNKIIANMGDLGSIPPLVFSFKNTVPFYPDCYWWTLFLNESPFFFDEAKKIGIGEDCCFVRAALGAFSKLAYFPKPDLGIAATGASCDDMAAVTQQIERLGHQLHWFEIPHRRDVNKDFSTGYFTKNKTSQKDDQTYTKNFIVEEFKNLIPKLEKVSSHKYDREQLVDSIHKINKLRKLIERIKDITFSAAKSPLPALEIMNIEFIALSAYSDLDEAIIILEHILQNVQFRVENNLGITKIDAVRVAWITPPADPLLLNYLEDLGGRLVATEFVINQALYPLQINGNPLEALADGMLNGSLMGTSKRRADEIIKQAKKYNTEGVIISNVFASSHCAYETSIIKEQIRKELNIPVLTFDVVAPGKQMLQSQILNRMAAFMEMLKEKKN